MRKKSGPGLSRARKWAVAIHKNSIWFSFLEIIDEGEQ
jgi:hypothetical protein